MGNIIQKLTSRKFLLALVGVVSGLAMAFGVEGSEITEVVSTVAGIVAALGSIVAYNVAEAKVDAAATALPELIEIESETE
jgi:phage shock protein PspC (stress-responsive transcriptional regulator)